MWLHNEFLTIADGTKMSKSKGNFAYVQDLVEGGFSGDVIRLYLVSSYYRRCLL